ncbi:mycothiol-dependent nitroreductase Rv2466c family protein [Mycobacterium bourgelatii]|uniref:DSBA oxidoreductase n=1 Tax=Mycobacterium bourgelatii TaxID=1273442 RepID=A0A7I9YJV0_MYCBU|nr:hypothetical protein MBOU_08540 [Mycobacterium bourgelatii]
MDGDRNVAAAVTIWFDPVGPFTWNTARWLKSVADDGDVTVDWRLMSLAVLNEGQEQSPQQQEHMRESRQIGRLMAAIGEQHGDVVAAYFAFGERFFDGANDISGPLVKEVCAAASSDVADAVLSDEAYDQIVRASHESGQEALGEEGGSPIVRINDRTFFGPVLTDPPAPAQARPLLDAFATLAAVPQFSQLKRPR